MQIEDTDSRVLLSDQSENGNTQRVSAETRMLDILIELGKERKLIIGATLMAGLIATVISLLLPPVFTATTTILPPQQPFSSSTALLAMSSQVSGLGAATGGLGLKNPTDLYVSLLKSRSVEDAMIQRFDLGKLYSRKRLSDTRREFEQNFAIEGSAKDGLIQIAVKDRDPRRATDMANAYLEEYKKFSANLAVTEASQRRLFFEQQLEQAKNSLATAEEGLKQSEQRSGMFQLDQQAKALIETEASLSAQIAAKEVQLRALSTYETPSNTEVILAREQLAGLQAQLKALGGRNASSSDDVLVSGGKIPGAGLDYIRKMRDVKYFETIFDLLARQYETARLDEARQGTIMQVVDPAIVPDRRTSPRRALIIIITSLSVLVLSIFLVLFRRGFESLEQDPENQRRLETLSSVWGKRTIGA